MTAKSEERADLKLAYSALRKMVLAEWPASVAEAVETWPPMQTELEITAEELAAVQHVETSWGDE